MREPFYSSQFKRDLKLAQKQGKPMTKLQGVMNNLKNAVMLPPSNEDHPLKGVYAGSRECHVEPDWLLIYRIDGQYIIFERLGSHSELF